LPRSKAHTGLTHFDARGGAHMVDVGAKRATQRVAIAGGRIEMQPATLARLAAGDTKKGDVLGVARIAAIQAAKRTAALIPLAHPIALTRVAVDFALDANAPRPAVEITTRVECRGQTGVEMEALSAAALGLLTIYDMLKAVDRAMTITNVMLLEKRGGRSGTFRRARQSAAGNRSVRRTRAPRAARK